MSEEIITLGGGCFWCMEAVFAVMDGVVKVESGYMGGNITTPSYEEVCSGATGHVEVVRITFSPETVSIKEILEVFFTVHNPTTFDRQGNDVGSQYRSVVYCQTPRQQEIADLVIREIDAAKLWDAPIVTQVKPAAIFYRAEDYHQDYFANNPNQPYCQIVVAPKVAKFREKFGSKVKRRSIAT